MKKTLSILLAAAALSTTTLCPPAAQAEDMKEMAVNTAMFPVKALGIGAGMALGIPIAITRRASSRAVEYTQNFADQIGGKENIPPMVFASVMGIPFGVLVGAGEGVYYGGRNAITNGSEKPFSLGSVSLDSELED